MKLNQFLLKRNRVMTTQIKGFHDSVHVKVGTQQKLTEMQLNINNSSSHKIDEQFNLCLQKYL